MAEPIRYDPQEEENRRREGQDELPPIPVYQDEARQRQSALYEQIAARGPFHYDPGQDPLYGIARDRAVQSGRMAMRDSMGQAAALTGGYDSSYGQAVGQQQYDASLQSLSELIPELYQTAYARYQDQGRLLREQAAQLGQQADRDYDRYRDEMGDWQRERAWQQERADAELDRAADAYARLYALISAAGYVPTEEELAAAGMSPAAADALRTEYLRQTGQLPAASAVGGGGGGSGGSRSSGRRFTLQDVTRAVGEASHSNQQRQLFETYRQAVADGRADFSLRELNELFRRNHWHS